MTALGAALALSPLLFEADRPGTEILLDVFLTLAVIKLFGRRSLKRLVAQSGSEAF